MKGLGAFGCHRQTDPGSVSRRLVKGAIVNLTKGLAVEFAEHGITVNCISPGQIPKLDTTDPHMVERARLMNPLKVTVRV